MAEASDAAIVQRVLDGDVEAFGVLVDRHHERATRFAERMLGTRADAEDVVQDAFLRAYRFLPNYQERERFEGWLFRILTNQCRTAAARRRRHALPFAEVREREAIERSPAPDRAAERSAVRQDIERALARLDPLQREAFLLKHVEELSYEEIAAMTGLGVSALKMRVKRACERLRALLTEVANVC